MNTEESDNEYNLCALCNNNDMYWYTYFFTCDGECKRTICDECDDEILDEVFCQNNNCYYCRNGQCYNNTTLNQYCSDCCPQEVLDEIEKREQKNKEREIEYKRITSTEHIRRAEIIEKLKTRGLKLRRDSKYCRKYIEQDDGDIDEIVDRMYEVDILYKNGMKKMLRIVKQEHADVFNAGYFPDTDVFDDAEKRILGNIRKLKI